MTKDRLYTMQQESRGRRSAQTAMFHILEAFTRWVAPILSFTADEIWGDVYKRQNPYRTLDFKFESDEIRALAKIVANGHLTRGAKPVHWCFDCGSALAEAEIEYQDKVSPAVDVAYTVRDVNALATALGVVVPADVEVAVPIWTLSLIHI